MKEKPGTAFLLTDEARYKWKHGIPPIEYSRISVTVRIFKPHLLTPEVKDKISKSYTNLEKEAKEKEREEEARKVSGVKEKLVVNFAPNSNWNKGKPAMVTSPVDIKV